MAFLLGIYDVGKMIQDLPICPLYLLYLSAVAWPWSGWLPQRIGLSSSTVTSWPIDKLNNDRAIRTHCALNESVKDGGFDQLSTCSHVHFLLDLLALISRTWWCVVQPICHHNHWDWPTRIEHRLIVSNTHIGTARACIKWLLWTGTNTFKKDVIAATAR